MIILTPKAIEKAKEVIAKSASPESGLRVAVSGGGCSGFQYNLSLETNPSSEDQVLDQDGLKIYIDPRSALYLRGVEIDYVELAVGAGFKFNNPNASSTCGCGESFNV